MRYHDKQESQTKVDTTPSNGELDRLRGAMESKVQELQNGRLQSRFFQVMFEWNVLRLMEDGRPMVVDPFAFTKWEKALSMIEASDARAEDAFFQAHPEERQKFVERVQEWGKIMRPLARGVGENMRV